MGLRWSIPLPGPFHVSGRVRAPGAKKAGRAVSKVGRALVDASAPTARERAEREARDRAAIVDARKRTERYDEIADLQKAWREQQAADKAAGHGPYDRVLAPRKMRQHREWARRQHLNGMPGSAGEYERMCDELRAAWPDIAAQLDAEDWDAAWAEARLAASSPEQQAREANARVAAGLTRAAGTPIGSFDAARQRLEQEDGRSLTRAEIRSRFGERRR